MSSLIEIEGVEKEYTLQNGTKNIILKDINLQIEPGSFVSLIGHSGCGKSTLFNILTGMMPTTSGHVSMFGTSLTELNTETLSQHMGICRQKDYLWNELTAMQHMMLHARLKGLGDIEAETECYRLLEIVGLHERKNSPAFNFSGGMKRRLSAAMSMIGDIKLLFLDGECDVA